ncbi:MAG TPA: DASS family sodium-coupled anion symporter [Polyangiaceae bacterium]|nr:DASS family sodium-coupled anion symporter [Polyangiaceae bacterium]
MTALALPARTVQRVGLLVGLTLSLLVGWFVPELHEIEGYGSRPAWAAAVVVMMAVFWLTEAVAIEVTACIPLLLFPLLGVYGGGYVSDLGATALRYLDAYVLLFFGGMTIGAAIEECGLHRRIALTIMSRLGAEPHRLMLGMLAATAFVSLWISNTATAVMMVPIAVALAKELELALGGRRLVHLGAALMLAVAYGANVGGIGTKIGTSTNSIFAGFVSNRLGTEFGFFQFSLVAMPFVLLFLPLVWLVLWVHGRRDGIRTSAGRAVLERELRALGAPSSRERAVGSVFLGAALLWMASDLVRPLVAPGFEQLFGFRFQSKHYEAGVALLSGFVLLTTRLLSLRALFSMPYGSLVLLGGSLAMAGGIEASGLSAWLSGQLKLLSSLAFPLQILLAAFGTIGLSAVASNTATINIVLNVLPQNVTVLFASALGASCDFMLPAGTPPNAIVFGSGYIRLSTMIRIGFLLNILAGLLITAYMLGYARFIVP